MDDASPGGSRAAGPLLQYQRPMRCEQCVWRGRHEELAIGGEGETHWYKCPKCESISVIEDDMPSGASPDLATALAMLEGKIRDTASAYANYEGTVPPPWFQEHLARCRELVVSVAARVEVRCQRCEDPITERVGAYCGGCWEQER